MKLGGKVAVVTGADSGIGQATAEAFAREGADVAISWRTDRDGAEETRRRLEALGRRAWVARADVADPASVRALFEGAQGALGAPDLLVANAGVGMSGMPVADMDDAKLEQVLRTDLMGPSGAPAPSSGRARRRAAAGVWCSSVPSPATCPRRAARPTASPRPG